MGSSTSQIISTSGASGTVDEPTQQARLRLLAPLRVPAYRFLWAGRAVSLVGDAFQLVVLPALVLDLTHRTSGLGAVLMAQAIPRALLMLAGGVLTDRLRARTVMFGTNLLLALIVGVLLVPIASERLEIWHLYVYAIAFGGVSALFLPASTSVVADLLPPEQVRAGNALSMLTANLIRFVVPPLAAAVVVASGESVAFAVNAASFVVAALLFWAMRPVSADAMTKPVANPALTSTMPTSGGTWQQVREGIRLARGDSDVWLAIQLSSLFWFGYGGALFVGLPALAKLTLEGGDQGLGILFGASGAGAFVGAMAAGSRTSIRRPALVACLSICATGVSLVGAGLATSIWMATPWLIAAGAFGSACAVVFLSLVQTRAPAAARGRLMSLMTLGVFGTAPLAYAVAGAIGDTLGPRGILIAAGLFITLAGLAGLTRKPLHQVV